MRAKHFKVGAVLLCVLRYWGNYFCHSESSTLLAEKEFAFSMSLSADFVKNKVKMYPYFYAANTHL